MEIHFTKNEYQALIELLYLGGKIYTEVCAEDDPHYESYQNVLSKLYSQGNEIGCKKLVKLQENGAYGPSKKLSNKMEEVFYAYKETLSLDIFLTTQAIEILNEELGENALEAMNEDERTDIVIKKKEELQSTFSLFNS